MRKSLCLIAAALLLHGQLVAPTQRTHANGVDEPCATRRHGDCKPSGPVAVLFEHEGGSANPCVLRFSLRPLVDLESVEWNLRLPDGAALMAGTGSGSAATARGAVTEGWASVALPAGPSCEIQLETKAALTVLDANGERVREIVRERATLSLGEPPRATNATNVTNVTYVPSHQPGRVPGRPIAVEIVPSRIVEGR